MCCPAAAFAAPHSVSASFRRWRNTTLAVLPKQRTTRDPDTTSMPSCSKREANQSLLSRFHYLSTVSGGGYIGSWLSAWRHRNDFPTVWRNLRSRPDGPDVEPPEMSWLRAYSNYLTPQGRPVLGRHLDRHCHLSAQPAAELAGDHPGHRGRAAGSQIHHHRFGAASRALTALLVAACSSPADRRRVSDRGAGLHDEPPADAAAAAAARLRQHRGPQQCRSDDVFCPRSDLEPAVRACLITSALTSAVRRVAGRRSVDMPGDRHRRGSRRSRSSPAAGSPGWPAHGDCAISSRWSASGLVYGGACRARRVPLHA